MSKLFITFMLLFIIGQFISGAIEGRSNIAATSLTSGLTTVEASTMAVNTTVGFVATMDVVQVDQELIGYATSTSTTFVTLTRGLFDTEPESHSNGTRVYNRTTAVINQSVGYNVAESLTNAGPFRVISSSFGFFGTAFSRLVLWDYSFLQGEVYGFPLVYLQLLGMALSFGLIVAVVLVVIGAAQSIFTGR